MQDYTVKGVARDMTMARFLAVLDAAQSPVGDDEARQVYNYALSRALSPAFLLAMFHHESTYGRFGSAATTHSWGNTRPPSFGAAQTGVTDRTFSIYANWVDGGVSTVARFFDHAPYQGKTTVRQIIPIWAPSTDGNDTERYIAAVLADIEKWTGGAAVGNPLAKFTTYQEFLQPGMPNVPGVLLNGGSANYITVHEVGNLNPVGGTARATKNFMLNGGGAEKVSFHAVVGDTESFQMLPWNVAAWHAGDGGGNGNYDSIGIETQQVGDWRRTIGNLAKLVADLMKEWAVPIERVVQHNHWSGKNCPQYLRAGKMPITGAPGITWPQFIGMVQREYNDLTKGRGDVREPEEGEFTVYQNDRKESIFVWNAGGQAAETVGINVVDLGISVKNDADETYDRSIQANVAQAWQGPR